MPVGRRIVHAARTDGGLLAAGHVADHQGGRPGAVVGVDEPAAVARHGRAILVRLAEGELHHAPQAGRRAAVSTGRRGPAQLAWRRSSDFSPSAQHRSWMRRRETAQLLGLACRPRATSTGRCTSRRCPTAGRADRASSCGRSTCRPARGRSGSSSKPASAGSGRPIPGRARRAGSARPTRNAPSRRLPSAENSSLLTA